MFVVEGRNYGEMERYHGKVTRVEYNETYAEWMYHVVYPQSEGHEKDEVDYWRDEIRPSHRRGALVILLYTYMWMQMSR